MDVAEETAESVETALFLNARRNAARNGTATTNIPLVEAATSSERNQSQTKSNPMQSTGGWSQTPSATPSTDHVTKTRQKPLEFSLGGFGTNSSQEPTHERILFGSTVAEAVSGSSPSLDEPVADVNLHPGAKPQQPMMQVSPQNYSSGYYVELPFLRDL